jgi:hypothetical protein
MDLVDLLAVVATIVPVQHLPAGMQPQVCIDA